MSNESTPLDFKSATIYAIRVVLQDADTESLIGALKRRMADAGSFFENEPVVVDASRVDEPIDWESLLEALSHHQLPVIGVVASGANLERAQECGLTHVELSGATVRSTTDTQSASAVSEPVQASTPMPAVSEPLKTSSPLPAAAESGHQGTVNKTPAAVTGAFPTMVVTGPLRSGQRVYARQSDLIVMGVVSRGAEVIADGNIHVYGPLRGKAMAGARGDAKARIFSTGLDAELVAVAGIYRVIDTDLPEPVRNKPAMVYLDQDALRITPLDQ